MSYGTMRFIALIVIIVALIKIVNVYLKKTKIKDKNYMVFHWIVIISSFTLMYFAEEWAAKKYGDHIGGFFETTGYTAQYYVNVFEAGNSTKNYELVADIYREEESGEYLITAFYWPNGGYSEFYDVGPDYPLVVGKRVEIEDDNDKTWFLQLTDRKVK